MPLAALAVAFILPCQVASAQSALLTPNFAAILPSTARSSITVDTNTGDVLADAILDYDASILKSSSTQPPLFLVEVFSSVVSDTVEEGGGNRVNKPTAGTLPHPIRIAGAKFSSKGLGASPLRIRLFSQNLLIPEQQYSEAMRNGDQKMLVTLCENIRGSSCEGRTLATGEATSRVVKINGRGDGYGALPSPSGDNDEDDVDVDDDSIRLPFFVQMR